MPQVEWSKGNVPTPTNPSDIASKAYVDIGRFDSHIPFCTRYDQNGNARYFPINITTKGPSLPSAVSTGAADPTVDTFRKNTWSPGISQTHYRRLWAQTYWNNEAVGTGAKLQVIKYEDNEETIIREIANIAPNSFIRDVFNSPILIASGSPVYLRVDGDAFTGTNYFTMVGMIFFTAALTGAELASSGL